MAPIYVDGEQCNKFVKVEDEIEKVHGQRTSKALASPTQGSVESQCERRE